MTVYRLRLLISLLVLAATGFSFIGGSATAQDATPNDPTAVSFKLVAVATGFNGGPLDLVDPDDGSQRLFIVQKSGVVLIYVDKQVLPTPFLDISGLTSQGSEQGLLGLDFHPDFQNNGQFFIDYTDVNGDSVIARYRVSEDDPNVADPASAEQLLFVDQPFPNHNGGNVMFGPDGYLYISFGDGGSQGDPNGNGQNIGEILGSIIRIDVDNTEGDKPYAIPDDNPYVDDPNAAPEIWDFGLRNPWRFSWDRETGELYIGDVGGGIYEEINVEPRDSGGFNYGWVIMEGPECYEGAGCSTDGLTLPVAQYTHEFGCSLTGGYVYRGDDQESLIGLYFFADYCSGLMWALGKNEAGDWIMSNPIETGLAISSFGEDRNGEIYVTDLNGGLYRLVDD